MNIDNTPPENILSTINNIWCDQLPVFNIELVSDIIPEPQIQSESTNN
jgi:hypothetical protein